MSDCVLFAEALTFEAVMPTMQALLVVHADTIDELLTVPCDNRHLTAAQKKLLHLT